MNQKDFLYKFHKHLNKPYSSFKELIEDALILMEKELGVDKIYFFNWYPQEEILSLEMLCSGGICTPLQEEIYLNKKSTLRKNLTVRTPYISKFMEYTTMYIEVEWNSVSEKSVKKHGVLRIERTDKNKPFTKKEAMFANEIAKELSHNMSNAQSDQYYATRLKRVDALNELSKIFATSMRIKDSVGYILSGIQKYFGFDRVRLYLEDKKAGEFFDGISVDLSSKITNIKLKNLTKQERDFISGMQNKFNAGSTESYIYLPLKVKQKQLGFLVCDNLLSRVNISYEDFIYLRQFSSQIALSLDNALLFDKVKELSNFDELTGLAVRRYFDQRLKEEVYRSKRFKTPFALIVADIDWFKNINDKMGHPAGDWVLKKVSEIIKNNLRQSDFCARYGGDEITMLLPRTNQKEAKQLAVRLQKKISELKMPKQFFVDTDIEISVSQGVSVFPKDGKTYTDIIKKADKALYFAKNRGRGGVFLYEEMMAKSRKKGVIRKK
ncbi:MAG: GGDEF domain-containing protein [Elusimicrobiaceae bacterium]|jgi:diguanylate cyclase (GGDEF)-like protein|nr:GGDEF domain-containing protein [Elusimicrobiaceae bacterium]MBT4007933.1 GGDEF domain-containing protein [Elusimicrobiaceae bacterium]MBT4403141.1 GGDEF domain-containing protein [Elusimicrobiaceae bacterium]MBT4439947.1 GGDEF domain-containing protein [Elusimicrobiaceae bacterium]MBT5987966.1 GGDEF domain-containing protein [Elusimicrobiaceae bacterium]